MISIIIGSLLAIGNPGDSGHVKKKGDDYKLVWSEEFNKNGAVDTTVWQFEKGFVRNNELQWYQPQNAWCENGKLIIEARRETKPNPRYKEGSSEWREKKKGDCIHFCQHQYTSF